MASTSSNDKPTPQPSQQSPPPQPDLFDCIRRFTDHHIASVLHSLIGVPTMLPPSNNWIMDEQDAPRPTSTNPTPETPTKSTEHPSQQNSTVPPLSQSTRGRMAEYSLLSDPRTSIFRPEEEQRLAQVWRQMSVLHRDFAAPFFGGDVWGTGMGKGWDMAGVKPLFWSVGMVGDGKRNGILRRTGEEGERGEEEEEEGRGEETTETEMDAYNAIAPPASSRTFLSTTSASSTSFASGQQDCENTGKPKVVATVATTRSYTDPNGVTRTTYVLKKRFADGSEERVEEDRTSMADNGVRRISRE